MISWAEAESRAAERLIDLALAEDLGDRGDLTSQATVAPHLVGTARLMGRAPGIFAGLPILPLVYRRLDPRVQVATNASDGAAVQPGQVLAVLRGPYRSLLMGERTALNFLQRLSGVATQTRRYADALAGLPCKLLDTRKTTPGWRVLEKYAVRCGGGTNHRQGLFDAVMIKDNHLAALGGGASAITQAVAAARRACGQSIPLEVEVDSLAQLPPALAAGPDVVLLDNFSLADLRAAVTRRNHAAPSVKLEASGGITLANIREVGETGVDSLSVGALTHSAMALDLALDFDPPEARPT